MPLDDDPIPATMRAMVAGGAPGEIVLRSVPVPVPGPGEILVRVRACGVCHSDLHIVDGDWPLPRQPVIPGHEVIGRVVALGGGVARPALGATVGVPWLGAACGHCLCCEAGMEAICPDKAMTGYNRDGGYADYVVATADFVLELPPDVDAVALAPVLCAGLTSYRGLKRSDARPGDWVAVVGLGGLGHLGVQYARAMGFRPIAVDISPAKLDQAGRLGAVAAVDARAPDAIEAVKAASGGGVHAALVTAPSQRAFAQAVEMLRPGGTCVFVGLPGDGDTLPVSIAGLSGQERTLRGSNVGTRLDLAEAVGFALRGAVASHVEAVPLAEAGRALDRLRRGAVDGRLVLTMEDA